jgi:thiol-disulfide isomerase/thioredoxin
VAKKNSPKFTTSSGKQKSAAQIRLEGQRALAAQSSAAAAKRRRRMTMVYTPIGVVLVIVIILVVVASTLTGKHHATHNATPASDAVSSAVTGVPANVFDQVGVGGAQGPLTELTGAALTADGKPRILYVGAEWCPFCAAERWPLAVALSRFGTLTGLGVTRSASNDTDPNTPTLTFVNASYASDYISFSGNEIEDGNRKTIKTLDAADQALFDPTGQGGSFPYLNLAGKFQASAQYDPKLLGGNGKTQEDIAATLSDPDSKIGSAIVGSANVLTAAICQATNNQPSDVCTSAGVTAAAKTLPS